MFIARSNNNRFQIHKEKCTDQEFFTANEISTQIIHFWSLVNLGVMQKYRDYLFTLYNICHLSTVRYFTDAQSRNQRSVIMGLTRNT